MTTAIPLPQYEGKTVQVTFTNRDGKSETVVGSADVANEMCLLLRKKGGSSTTLIEKSQITSISLHEPKVAPVRRKVLNVPTLNTARGHLADRHGYKASEADLMTDELAFHRHAEIDHSDLSHSHDIDPLDGD